jgi:hypothetical protein
MWLIQRVVHQGVVSLTQQLMHIVIVFVIFVVVVVVVVVGGGGGGGGGVWNRLCVLRLVVYSLVLLSAQLSGLFVGFVVHSTVRWFCCPLNCPVCAPLSEVVLASIRT